MAMNGTGGRVGPFHLQKLLGEGGQSVVWLAFDVRKNSPVALKVLRSGVASPNDIARLRREAALLGSFSDPALPAGIELYEDGSTGTVALAMQYVDGTPLHKVPVPIPPPAVVALGRELARVLGVVHSQGIVHRDLKPGNVLVKPGWEQGPAGSIVLVDFGIAKGTGGEHATKYTATGGAVGTVAFMAPEVLLSSAVSPHPTMDVYSVGVMLWVLVTGRHPTGLALEDPLSKFVLAHAQPKPAQLDPNTFRSLESAAPGLLAVLGRCVEADPARRYASMAQLASDLGQVAASVPNPALHTGVVMPAASRSNPASGGGPVAWTGTAAPGAYTQFVDRAAAGAVRAAGQQGAPASGPVVWTGQAAVAGYMSVGANAAPVQPTARQADVPTAVVQRRDGSAFSGGIGEAARASRKHGKTILGVVVGGALVLVLGLIGIVGLVLALGGGTTRTASGERPPTTRTAPASPPETTTQPTPARTPDPTSTRAEVPPPQPHQPDLLALAMGYARFAKYDSSATSGMDGPTAMLPENFASRMWDPAPADFEAQNIDVMRFTARTDKYDAWKLTIVRPRLPWRSYVGNTTPTPLGRYERPPTSYDVYYLDDNRYNVTGVHYALVSQYSVELCTHWFLRYGEPELYRWTDSNPNLPWNKNK